MFSRKNFSFFEKSQFLLLKPSSDWMRPSTLLGVTSNSLTTDYRCQPQLQNTFATSRLAFGQTTRHHDLASWHMKYNHYNYQPQRANHRPKNLFWTHSIPKKKIQFYFVSAYKNFWSTSSKISVHLVICLEMRT